MIVIKLLPQAESNVRKVLFDARSQGVLPFSAKKSGKKSCSGLIHNCVILSDKSDKIREILNKKLNTLSRHPLWMRPLHDFFPLFFCTFFVRAHLPTERHVYKNLWVNISNILWCSKLLKIWILRGCCSSRGSGRNGGHNTRRLDGHRRAGGHSTRRRQCSGSSQHEVITSSLYSVCQQFNTQTCTHDVF